MNLKRPFGSPYSSTKRQHLNDEDWSNLFRPNEGFDPSAIVGHLSICRPCRASYVTSLIVHMIHQLEDGFKSQQPVTIIFQSRPNANYKVYWLDLSESWVVISWEKIRREWLFYCPTIGARVFARNWSSATTLFEERVLRIAQIHPNAKHDINSEKSPWYGVTSQQRIEHAHGIVSDLREQLRIHGATIRSRAPLKKNLIEI